MSELLELKNRHSLTDYLCGAFLTVQGLLEWLRAHYPKGLATLRGGDLMSELVHLMEAANAEDGMCVLLQRLADSPPITDLPGIIHVLTHGKITRRVSTARGLPHVSADQRLFVANRPFVNRSALRAHLRALGDSEGADRVLVVDGAKRTGKSFTVSMAMGFDAAQEQPVIDVDAFAQFAARLNARDLVILIAGGDDQGCPPVDETKEDEAVPRLMYWLEHKLGHRDLWIIVDHCRRPALSRAARTILCELARTLDTPALRKIRLILVDFEVTDLPKKVCKRVRVDRAELPDALSVAAWCQELAETARRDCPADKIEAWVREVFDNLTDYSREDGSWHAELEERLTAAADRILACEEL